MKKKISDIFTTDYDLFGAIKTQMNSLSMDVTLFDTFLTDSLNILYYNSCGEKTVSKLAFEDSDTVATTIVVMYGLKWIKQFNLFQSELPLYNYTKNINEVIIDDGNTTDVNSETNLNQVSAFNIDDTESDTLSDKEKDTKSSDGTGTSYNERTRTYSESLLNGSTVDEILKQMDYLQHNFIYDIIFKDINRVLTLAIY